MEVDDVWADIHSPLRKNWKKWQKKEKNGKIFINVETMWGSHMPQIFKQGLIVCRKWDYFFLYLFQ